MEREGATRGPLPRGVRPPGPAREPTRRHRLPEADLTAPAPTSRIAGSGLPADGLADLDTEAVEARSLPTSPAAPVEVRALEWHLSDLWLPAVVLHEEALVHNLDRFAAWCAERGVDLAPHGKTTMAPQLWAAQIDRGAWAITAATAGQARIMHRYGVPRVLLANEVADPAQLSWITGAVADPDFEIMCLVDSPAGASVMEQNLADAPEPLPVLVELGVAGRRAGVRELDEALALAERVAHSDRLRLVGVEGFEGVFPQRRAGEAPEAVRTWLDRIAMVAERADALGLFAEAEEILVTAGGSGYPDLAAEALTALPELSRPVRPVVRSGCYLTHDDLSMERTSPLRSGADPDPLRPALSCFARVLSCPESGRALLGAGKRDVPYDLDLPVVRAIRRNGTRTALAGKAEVVELNDHHAFVDAAPDTLEVGDVVELGLSHPCTAFDKWPLIPVLNSQDRVVDAVRTLF